MQPAGRNNNFLQADTITGMTKIVIVVLKKSYISVKNITIYNANV